VCVAGDTDLNKATSTVLHSYAAQCWCHLEHERYQSLALGGIFSFELGVVPPMVLNRTWPNVECCAYRECHLRVPNGS
jgi:hypothetical protein